MDFTTFQIINSMDVYYRMCKGQSVVLFMLSLYLTLLTSTEGFNIDVNNVKTWTGPPGTRFGYTLAFNPKAFRDGKISLLVGAPKENTTGGGQNMSSGTVHICSYTDKVGLNCGRTKYNFPMFSNDPNTTTSEGYGSSLSISPSGDVLACAPFWTDNKYVTTKHYLFMPGRCFVERADTWSPAPGGLQGDITPFYHPPNEPQLYTYAPEYYHGLASFGLSSSSDSSRESIFAVGAPGLTIFEGAVYVVDVEKNTTTSTDIGYRNTLGDTDNGYLGYEVKIGKFCDINICLAAGAPNLKQRGKVRLYRLIFPGNYNFQSLEGENSWSYFGSVLGAVDVDKDGIDELLVGAPYYSETGKENFDKGRVYVYKINDLTKDFDSLLTLDGSGKKYSRFGSAIQSIGDINLDGFPDVAIGAPDEEEGTGCIYIYQGSAAGLHNKYSQRICANEIPGHANKLKRFGSTISSSTKLFDSPYPAFAASSYLTDTILMFTVMPTVQAKVTITANPNPIDIEKRCVYLSALEPCTIFDVCFTQKWQGLLTKKLNFDVTVELDTKRRYGSQPRVEFFLDQDRKYEAKFGVLRGENFLKEVDEKESCQKIFAVTKKSQITKDRFTPIGIEVTLKLDKENTAQDNVILDPTVPNNFVHQVSIANGCGPDNVCNVDLTLEGEISLSHKDDWPFIVVGVTKELKADMMISNVGETSYGTRFTIELNQPLQFLRFESDVIKQCTPETGSGESEKIKVVCNSYQPLSKNEFIKISLIFETVNVALNKQDINVFAEAKCIDEINSDEKKKKNNRFERRVFVFIVADVNIFGTSSPSEITIRTAKRLSLVVKETISKNFSEHSGADDPFTLNHKFQMKNIGPSFLPKTAVYLNIPVYLADASQLIAGLAVQFQYGDQGISNCTNLASRYIGQETVSPIRPSFTTPSYDDVTTTLDTDIIETTTWNFGGVANKRRKKRAADDDEDYSKTYFLTCATSPEYCISVRCDIPSDLPTGGHTEINVTLTIDKALIPVPKGFTSFYLQLTAFVKEPSHLLFWPWTIQSRNQASTRTSTTFHLVESGGEISIWIILGSVIAGFLLIVIIAVIFWKLGFFKRQKRHEVQEWKRKSLRMSKIPKMPDPEPKEDAT